QMRFQRLAVIEVGSMLLSLGVACFMAWLRCGYWSLVGMQLSAAASATLLTLHGSGWRPRLPSRKQRTLPLLRFGLDLTAASFVARLARGSDTVLLGKVWGPGAVGLYSRASVLFLRPMDQCLSPISAVLLPILSRLQNDPERYRRAFLRVYDSLALLSFPVSALFLALAGPVILVLLGRQWEGAVSLVAGFTAADLYMPLAVAATWLFTSQGRTRELLKTNAVLSVVIVLAFIAGLPYGALGMVLFFSASGLLVRLPVLYYLAGRQGPVRTAMLWE